MKGVLCAVPLTWPCQTAPSTSSLSPQFYKRTESPASLADGSGRNHKTTGEGNVNEAEMVERYVDGNGMDKRSWSMYHKYHKWGRKHTPNMTTIQSELKKDSTCFSDASDQKPDGQSQSWWVHMQTLHNNPHPHPPCTPLLITGHY